MVGLMNIQLYFDPLKNTIADNNKADDLKLNISVSMPSNVVIMLFILMQLSLTKTKYMQKGPYSPLFLFTNNS